MRYYSVMRPVMPGSYPKKAAVQEIENFNEKHSARRLAGRHGATSTTRRS